jgi:putative thioredoxin
MSAANVAEVNEADFQSRVVDASRQVPVVVDFWAGWCQPCLILSPILERLAQEYGGRFTLAKVDVDANPELAARYRVQGIPAVQAFVDGAVASEFVGVQSEDLVRRFIDQVVPSAADQRVAEAGSASPEQAEEAFRGVLAEDPGHAGAAAGLAELLLARGQVEEAGEILSRVAEDEPVRRLRAEIDLRTAASEASALGAAARAALSGDHRAALEQALAAVANGDQARDRARELMVRLFAVLGDDHPLTQEYRSRLASALY